MSKQEMNDNLENEHIDAENLAEDVSKEPLLVEDDEITADESANVSDEMGALKDSLLRVMAEYDNYRKRTIKEKAELIKNGGEKVLIGLLPVMDDFQRALENVEKAKDMNGVKEGIELIYSKFRSFLSQNGVKPIETVGQPFDPEVGEAVAMIPAQDEEQKGIIVDDVQTGYTLNDKVIRHAKVVVAN